MNASTSTETCGASSLQPVVRRIGGLTSAEYQREYRKRNAEKYIEQHNKDASKRKQKEHEYLGTAYPQECKCRECKTVFNRDDAHARGFRFFGRYNCVCDECAERTSGATAMSAPDTFERSEPLARPRIAVSSHDWLCLSVRQPWAWLIVNGWKNIENRNWSTVIRGPILIHAGKAMTADDYEACQIFMAAFTALRLPPPEQLKRGGIVGQATLLDCVSEHSSEWFVGDYGFVLADQKPLAFEPLKGQLGFFKVRRHNEGGQ